MLPEKSQKCKGLLADTHHGILHLFGRDKSQITLYTLIMPFDFFSQIIYSSVDDKSIPTTPVSPSFFRVPYGRVDRYLCTYLYPLSIYAYLAQQLTRFILADFSAVYIKQYRKRTATLDFRIVRIHFHNLHSLIGLLNDH